MDSIAELIVMIGDVGMSDKALLVMNMPDTCEKCPFCDFGDYTCGAFGVLGENFTYDVNEDGILDLCPLKPMPEKKNCDTFSAGSQIRTWREGWNACIDKILEEEEWID